MYQNISVIAKLYGSIIKKILQKKIIQIEIQSGFEAGPSCNDNAFILRKLVEKRLEKILSTKESLLFVVIKNACDSVFHTLIFQLLEETGLLYTSEVYENIQYKNSKFVQNKMFKNGNRNGK